MSSPGNFELESITGPIDLTDDEVEQNYAYRERFETDGGLESLEGGPELALPPEIESLRTEDIAGLISQKAHDLVYFFEVGGTSGYQKTYKFPCWPGLSSGITIGIGYDLGFNTLATFERDWKAHLSSDDFALLARTVQRKGQNAKALLASVRHIVVPWEKAVAVYHATTVPKFTKLTLSTFPNVRDLHPHAFGALFSLVYNRGAKLTGEKRRHMRHIRDHAASKRFRSIPKEFRDMKVIWPIDKFSGLHKRRDAEARLFEDGLIEADTSVVVTLPPVPPDSTAGGLAGPGATAGFGGLAGMAGTQSGGATSRTLAESLTAGTDPWYPLEHLEAFADALGEYEGEPPEITDDMVPPPAPFSELESAPAWAGVAWVKDDDLSSEYRHIRPEDREMKDCSFEFTARDLELLIRANGFHPRRASGRIVFGLRGAMLEASTEAPKEKSYQIDRAALRLRETRPDHQNFRCVIGVYDIASQRLSGFIATTVPNRGYVQKASKKNGKGANLLPCGCYAYTVGPHTGLAGCLREAEPFTVLRTTANLLYDTNDDWSLTPKENDWPYDNIHPAFVDRFGSAKFSSAGCQVIEGSINRKTGAHTGVWALFRKSLGLSKPGIGDHGLKFSYVLFTGLEAAIATRLRESETDTDFAAVLESLGRLRHGSEGEHVVKLQRILGLPETGRFDAAMRKKLTDYQKVTAGLGWADGLYGPEIDRKLANNVYGTEQPPIVVASVARPGPQIESMADPLESLYYEIGRRSLVARTNPQLAAEPYLPQIGTVTTESFFDVLGMGRRVFARIERAAHDLICGDQSTDSADRDVIQQTLLDAAKIGPEQVKEQLTNILTVSLGILGPIAAIAARIIVEKVLEPAFKDAHSQVAPMLQGACTAWARELNKRIVLAGLEPIGQTDMQLAAAPGGPQAGDPQAGSSQVA